MPRGSEDRKGKGNQRRWWRVEYVPWHVRGINDVLAHIMMCIGEDWVEPWPHTSLLCHNPWSHVIHRSGALIPVCSDSVYSSVIEGEESL